MVSLENRFERTPDGAIWTRSVFTRAFWNRYLEVFDSVRVVARLLEKESQSPGSFRADGGEVSFADFPYYLGPVEYLKTRKSIRGAIHMSIGPNDAVLLRLGSPIGGMVDSVIRPSKRPFGVEVVGDPHATFAPGAISHPARPIFRWWFSRELRSQCGRASAAAYVTESALQLRYPPRADAFATHYSSIELSESDLSHGLRTYGDWRKPPMLVMVGTLEQMYKAPDVLLQAVSICNQGGVPLCLTFVGGGKQETVLRAKASELGLGGHVSFLGHVPAGDLVRGLLDQADLFVLPSRQEGLPRAMIEAMARGLPCIGSTVGGIPELLPPEDMVLPGDAAALAEKIREVLSDPARMERMSARNLAKAAEYRDDILRERRNGFYRVLRDSTQAWIDSRAAS